MNYVNKFTHRDKHSHEPGMRGIQKRARALRIVLGITLLVAFVAAAVYYALPRIQTYINAPRPMKLSRLGSDSPYMFGATSGDLKIFIADRQTQSPTISVHTISANSVQLSFVNESFRTVAPKQTGNTVSFSEIADGIDLQYSTLPNGLKEEIIIKKPYQSNVFTFSVQTNNAHPKSYVTGFNSPVFYSSTGDYLFHFAKPFAVDAAGSRTDDVLLQIRPTGIDNKLTGSLTVDNAWFNSSDRVYPIIIDPTIVHDSSSEFSSGSFDRSQDTGSGATPNIETAYQELPVDRFTTGLWRANETANDSCSGGQDLCDSSGNGLHGTATGTTINTGVKKLGAASRSFNGSSDFITVTNTAALSDAGDLTVEAWFKTSNSGAVNIIISRGTTSDWLYAVSTSATGNFTCKTYQANSGAGYLEANDSSSAADGNWHHGACVVKNNILHVYLDGRLVATDTSPTGTRDTSTAGNLFIGKFDYTGGTYNFNGLIDEIRLSNTARTPDEIRFSASRRPYSIFTSDVMDLAQVNDLTTLSWSEIGGATGNGETLHSSTGLAAQWNFNETSGTTADNAQGTAGYDLTLTNFDNTSSRDADPDSTWSANNRRWGAGALLFDGTDSYARTSSAINYAPTTGSSFSIETWINTRTMAPAAQAFIQSEDGTGTGRTLLGISTGKFYTNIGGTPLYSNTVPQPGVWYHVAVVYNGTGETLYVNGKQETSASNIVEANNALITLGAYKGAPPAAGGYFNGTMDSTRFYTRALAPSEILANYNAGSIELQTRVGADTSPDDGSWEAWKPTTGETQLLSFDTAESSATRVYSSQIDDFATNQSWHKTYNTVPANSDTTSTAGRIPLGTAGKGDQSHAYAPTILYDNDVYKMWYLGQDATNSRMYYATSSDGLTWTKYDNTTPSNSNAGSSNGRLPLGTDTTGDDAHVGYATVIKDGSTYKMWYSGQDGTNWRIFYATSSDGLTWTKYNNAVESPSNTTGTNGRIPLGSSGGDSVRTLRPSVIKDGSTYKMWYTGYDGTNYRIYYATSNDGLTWTKYNNAVPAASDKSSTDGRIPLGSNGTADDAHTYEPTVIKDGNMYKMWYNMHDGTNVRIGYATSLDGLTWTKQDNSVQGTSDSNNTNGMVRLGSAGMGDQTHAYSPNVIKVGNTYKMWYSGHNGTNWRIFSASMSPSPVENSLDGAIKMEGSYSKKLSTLRQQPDYNTIGLWRLNETGGTGAYLKDASGNGNHGTPTGTTVINGVSGKGRNFNGSSYITLSNEANFDLERTYNFSASAWVKTTSTSQQVIVSKMANAAPYTGYEMFLSNTGYLSVYFINTWSTNVLYEVASTNQINDGKWHHVGFTYYGYAGSASGNLYLFVDGQSVATTITYDTLSGSILNNVSLNIGSRNGSSLFFNGDIDEVRINNTAYNANDFMSLYRAGAYHHLNETISSTNLSGATSLPFYVAADRPGTYLETVVGESVYGNYQPDASTVGFWRMDDIGGNVPLIKDSSVYANGGTPTGTTVVQGKMGNARWFNGTSDLISVPDSNTLDLTTAGTVELWFNRSATQNYQMLLTKGDGSNPLGYQMMDKSTTNQVVFRWAQDSDTVTSKTVVPNNTWTHVAGTYDGSTAKLYINGVLDNSVNHTTNAAANALPLRIGSRSDGYYYAGAIDEVRISNTARSAADIRAAYEIGRRSHPVTVDFGAKLDSGNLISNSGDTSFTVDATVYGLTSKGDKLYKGDKVIVKENYDGTEYAAQGTVTAVTASTGAITVASWDAGGTFPSGGFTANADVFKWQREYWPVANNTLSSFMDGITTVSLRLTNGNEGRTIWFDDLRSSGGYLSNPSGEQIPSTDGQRYIQYRAIGLSTDPQVSSSLGSVTVDFTSNRPNPPTIGAPTANASSVRWNFTDTASNETGFRVYDTNESLMATCAVANVTYCDETGLTPNTQHSRKVTAYNAFGNSIYSDTATIYTLAAVPPAPAASNRTTTTVQVNPGAGTNPVETLLALYRESGTSCDGSGGAYVAADGSSNGATPVWQTDAQWGTVTISGLTQETAYAFCVKAKNGDNVETAFSSSGANDSGYAPIAGDFVITQNTSMLNKYVDGSNPARYVAGVDAGSDNINTATLEIQGGILTVNGNETVVAGDFSLTGGSIAIAAGGQLKPGAPLWGIDSDADGYTNDQKLWYGAQPPNGRRKYLLTTLIDTDCNDASYNASNVCCTANGGACASDGTCCSSICGTNADGDNYFSQAIGHSGTCQATAKAYTDCNDSGANAANVATSATCYVDSDNDNYGSVTAKSCISAGATCATATWASDGEGTAASSGNFASVNTDCYDSNANAYPSSAYCSSTHRGDGSYDYNCSSTATKCGTNYDRTTVGTGSNYTDICGSCNQCNVRCCGGTHTVYNTATINCGQTGGVCTSFTGCSGGSCTRNVGEMCGAPNGACEDYHGSAPTCNLCNAISQGTQACQ